MTNEEEIAQLKKRIEQLEARPSCPYIPPAYAPNFLLQYWPQPHYHGIQPCYLNPCVWC